MPKYLPETAERKAKSLAKTCIENGLNETRIAKALGTSHQAVNQRLQKAPVKKALQEIINQNLIKAGITQTKVYRKLDEQLDATKVISAVVVNKKDRATSLADGELFDANEKTNDFIDVPDHIARDKAIDKCLTLMGHIKQVNGNGKGISIVNIMYGYRVNAPDRTIRPEARAS